MLSPEILERVRYIRIRTRRLVHTMFAGHYHSAFKGRGIEFAEVREYVPGDDVRGIDWHVTARRGQLYMKQYVEERELTVMLLVDLSASGQFGSVRQRKIDLATELCAILALSAIMNHDRVGLILFTDQIEKFVPPQKGRRHVLRVIGEVLSFQPQRRGTNIGLALEYLHRINRRRTTSFLLSDFLTSDYTTALRLARRRHDIIPISLIDQRELSLPRLGLVTLQDLETGASILVDTSSATVQRQYEQRWNAALARRRQIFQSLGIDAIEVRTDTPYVGPLMRFFRARERRR